MTIREQAVELLDSTENYMCDLQRTIQRNGLHWRDGVIYTILAAVALLLKDLIKRKDKTNDKICEQ